MDIVFTNVLKVPEEFAPKPASQFVPGWYKQMNSYGFSGKKEPDGSGKSAATIKRCMPVFDAITSGYIITSYVDVWVKQKKTDDHPTPQPFYEWPAYIPMEFHDIGQAPTYPQNKGHKIAYPKWINAWGIKTPPGYSCLFVTPSHQDLPFSILPGIVDTDAFNIPVNFPFVLNEPESFEGLIPAGTPLAQVIPFKRDSWRMSIGSEEDVKNSEKSMLRLRSRFFDGYNTLFRKPKEYK